MSKEDIFNQMTQSIITGDRQTAESMALYAIDNKLDLIDVIEKGFIPGIQKVGDLWEEGEYFLPELITSSECMKSVMNILQPEMEKAHIQKKSLGKIVIGTVQGDIHDIGKNLVASMFSANGFDVIDLGGDVPLEKFIDSALEVNADFICMSALLTTTMLGQKQVIEMLKKKEIRDRFKVMVGGSPVTQKWANEIGADGYAENATQAVITAKKLS